MTQTFTIEVPSLPQSFAINAQSVALASTNDPQLLGTFNIETGKRYALDIRLHAESAHDGLDLRLAFASNASWDELGLCHATIAQSFNAGRTPVERIQAFIGRSAQNIIRIDPTKIDYSNAEIHISGQIECYGGGQLSIEAALGYGYAPSTNIYKCFATLTEVEATGLVLPPPHIDS